MVSRPRSARQTSTQDDDFRRRQNLKRRREKSKHAANILPLSVDAFGTTAVQSSRFDWFAAVTLKEFMWWPAAGGFLRLGRTICRGPVFASTSPPLYSTNQDTPLPSNQDTPLVSAFELLTSSGM